MTERHRCPLCNRLIGRSHFKRHLAAHDRHGADRDDTDRAWLAFTETDTLPRPHCSTPTEAA